MNNELDLKLGIGKQTSWIKNKPSLQTPNHDNCKWANKPVG